MICVCVFSIIGCLVEAGARTRGMRGEYAPGPVSFFSCTFSSFSVITDIFFHSSFRVSCLLFALSRYTRPVFALHGRLVRRCIVAKVLIDP